MEFSQKEINELLEVRYIARDGKLVNIFTINDINDAKSYNCIICSINCLNAYSLVQHAKGKKHKQMTDLVNVKKTETTTRGKVETSNLQATIDEIRDQAMIGLEYIIEVPSIWNLASTYHCVLCQRKFDRISRLIRHLTDYKHRLKYLKKHFATVFEEISDLTEAVCEGIENHFGRLFFLVVENGKFAEKRTEFINTVLDSKHINEDMGRTFVEIIKKGITKDFEVKGNRNDLRPTSDVISISSDSCSENEVCKSVDVTPLNSIPSSSQKEEQEDKLKTFRFQMKVAMSQLKQIYQTYIDDPCNHSRYYELWSIFWNTHYKQLSSGSNHFQMYDWHTQWATEWRKIMQETLYKDIETKSNELKENLGMKATAVVETEKIETQLKDELGIVPVEAIVIENVHPQPTEKVIESTVVKPSLESVEVHKEETKKSNPGIPSKDDNTTHSDSKLRSRSPRHSVSLRRSRQRSLSQRRSRRRSLSSRRFRRKSRSPLRSTRKSRSPLRSTQKSRSPLRSIQKSRSPKRSTRKSRSPQRYTRKSRSPVRSRRSRSPLTSLRRTSPHEDQTARRRRISNKNSHFQSHINRSNKKTSSRKTSRSLRTQNKSSSPLRLEELMKNQKASNDFILSLLDILEIENTNQSISGKEDKSIPAPPHIVGEQSVDCYSSETSIPPKQLNGESEAPVRHHPAGELVDTKLNEPITIITTLRLLIALEDILGSLGPKSIDLMHKAIAMDKSMPDSSNTLIDDEVTYTIFQTMKEKLKGLLSVHLVESNKQYAVKKAIEDIGYLTHQRNERKKIYFEESTIIVDIDDRKSLETFEEKISLEKTSPEKTSPEKTSPEKTSPEKTSPEKTSPEKTSPKQTSDSDNRYLRQEIPSMQETSFSQTKKVYEDDGKSTSPPCNEDVVLDDWEVKILMTKFTTLSEKEKRSFVEYMKRLEISNPGHVRRLRNEILNTKDDTNDNESIDLTEDSFETLTVENDSNISTSGNTTKYPKERFYSDCAESILEPMKNGNKAGTNEDGQPLRKIERKYPPEQTHNQNLHPNLQENPYAQYQNPYYQPSSSTNPMQVGINPYCGPAIQYLNYR